MIRIEQPPGPFEAWDGDTLVASASTMSELRALVFSARGPEALRCTHCGEADYSKGDHGIGRCVAF